MGTPDFAIPSLELLRKKYDVAAVVTAVDKPQGHGNKLTPSPVKLYALKHNIPILQPDKLRNEEFLKQLDYIKADVYVIVGFRMLPQCVWGRPRLGTINLHASLLPDYRGAAPINWVLFNGEKKTGLTTFFIDDKIDTGEILQQTEERIFSCDTFETLYTRMKHKGAQLLLNTLVSVEEGTYKRQQQNSTAALHTAPKLTPELCNIDFSKSCEEVTNLVRGLSPKPGAYTMINDMRVKIFFCNPIKIPILSPGEIFTDGKEFLLFGTTDGFISVQELQPEGRKKMTVKDFLAGYRTKIKQDKQ
jgi:methionyl-tRNA formyltransferase